MIDGEGETGEGGHNQTSNKYLVRSLLSVASWLSSPGGWAWCCPLLCYKTHHKVNKGWGSHEAQGPSTHNWIIPSDQRNSVLCYNWESQSFLLVLSPPFPSPLPLNLLECTWHCCALLTSLTLKINVDYQVQKWWNWSARAEEPGGKDIFHPWWDACTFSPQVDTGGSKMLNFSVISLS